MQISTRRTSMRPIFIVVGIALLGAVILSLSPDAIGAPLFEGRLVALAPVVFLAGMFSALSPCCLPVLSAYIAYTLQAHHERLVVTSIAFFLGIASSLVALGATATALSQALLSILPIITAIGGVIIVGFGVMNALGKGFPGMHLEHQHTGGALGAYIYGATFALGWTACVGPILGALLTLLATQGLAVIQGALLSFIYALGIGAPSIALAIFLHHHDRSGRLWRVLRGTAITLHIGGRDVFLHTTNLASGLLLIMVGLMLATGQLAVFSRWAAQTPMTQWVLHMEESLRLLLSGW